MKITSDTNGGPTLDNYHTFGHSLVSVGDLDGDGVTDLAVGALALSGPNDATGNGGRGTVHVLFMKSDGTVRSSTKIASGIGGGPSLANSDWFGSSVALLGDLDGDGVPDLAVGAKGDDTGGVGRGAVHVLLMNSDGSVKNSTEIADGVGGGPTLQRGDDFGSSLTAVGDLDGDGVSDLVVGAYRDNTGNQNAGALHVLMMNSNGTVKNSSKIASGIDGGPTLEPNGLGGYAYFGKSVTSVGDLNGDGVTDLAVGAYGANNNDMTGVFDSGSVYVLFMNSAENDDDPAENDDDPAENDDDPAENDHDPAESDNQTDSVSNPSPTVTVNIVDTSLALSDLTSIVTFQFSESVVDFDESDITTVGGVLSDFTAVDGDSFVAIFTATEGIATTGSVAVGTGYTNLAGIIGTGGVDTLVIETIGTEFNDTSDTSSETQTPASDYDNQSPTQSNESSSDEKTPSPHPATDSDDDAQHTAVPQRPREHARIWLSPCVDLATTGETTNVGVQDQQVVIVAESPEAEANAPKGDSVQQSSVTEAVATFDRTVETSASAFTIKNGGTAFPRANDHFFGELESDAFYRTYRESTGDRVVDQFDAAVFRPNGGDSASDVGDPIELDEDVNRIVDESALEVLRSDSWRDVESRLQPPQRHQ